MIAELIDPAILGFILVGVMLFAIFVGFPISFTLIFLGFVFGYLGFGKLVFYLMTLQFSMVMTEQTLAAVPLFVFMGIMMEQAGLMERLFSAFQMMLARVKGSLYYAVLFVSVIFAAATGIVGASVTILGIMAAKSMNRSNYDVKLAAGTITAGGTLGILIPPSIMLVVMGPIMEIPVIDLFAAAIIPGILLASLYAGYTTIRCMINPKLGPVLPEEMRAASMKEVWIEFFLGLVPPAALVFAALGSILFGFATPTEAAGCGAMGALLLSLAYKKLTLSKLQEALVKTLEMTALLLVLMFVLSIFMVIQSVFREKITGQETELSKLENEVLSLISDLNLQKQEYDNLNAKNLAINKSLKEQKELNERKSLEIKNTLQNLDLANGLK